MWKQLILVALGSGIGGALRYGAMLLLRPVFGPTALWPTMAVNVVGCFAIGLAWGFLQRGALSQVSALFIMTGVLGGFTTFSAYSLEALQLYKSTGLVMVGVYLVATVVMGLLATWWGISLVK